MYICNFPHMAELTLSLLGINFNRRQFENFSYVFSPGNCLKTVCMKR